MEGDSESRRGNWVLLDVDTVSSEVEKLRKHLLAKIKGQPAIKDIADAFEVYYAGMKDKNKPICVILCLGPSGVGKTLTGQEIAEFLFGNRDGVTLITGEMLSEQHSTAKLTGSPPGYVGYGEPALLGQENIDRWDVDASQQALVKKTNSQIDKATNELDDVVRATFLLLEKRYFNNTPLSFVEELEFNSNLKILASKHLELKHKIEELKAKIARVGPARRPRSVIIVDEIEKANVTIHNLFLGVIDNARATMSNGDITHFDNSVIILTSNIGSEEIAEVMVKASKRPIGYAFGQQKRKKVNSRDQEVYEKAMAAARSHFRPEFLARMSQIIVYRQLSRETMAEIYDKKVRELREIYLDPVCVGLFVSAEARESIIDEATDNPAEGARLIEKKIHKRLKKQIARLKSRGELTPGVTLCVVVARDGEGGIVYKKNGRPYLSYYKEIPSHPPDVPPADGDTSSNE